MNKKSQAYYKYLQDMVSGKSSYYDSSEIEDAVFDLIDEGKAEEAIQLTETGIKLHAGDETLEKLLCWLYLHTQQVDKAEALFSKYENDGTDSTTRLKFCFEIMKGHPQSALSQFLSYLKDGGINGLDWVSTVDEMFDAIPRQVLAPKLIEASQLITDNAEALGRIGAMLMDCQEYRQAAQTIEKSLDLDAYDIFSWQDLTRCYYELKEIEKCADACDYGLAIDPDNPILNFTRGYLYYCAEDWENSIRTLEIARKFVEGRLRNPNIRLSEDEIQENANITYQILGYCYTKTDNIEKAAECYEILLERNPRSEEIIMQLATNLLDLGDLNKTLDLTEKAVEQLPTNTNILSLKASVLTSMHRYAEAIEVLQELHRLKPRNKNFLLAMAELAGATQQHQTADSAYRELLNLKPQDQNTRDRLWEYFASIGDEQALKQLKN